MGSDLRSYRQRLGLTVRGAARQIGVTHASIIYWERGTRQPRDIYRRAIETWSGGEVRADGWPLREEEQRVLDRVAPAVVA